MAYRSLAVQARVSDYFVALVVWAVASQHSCVSEGPAKEVTEHHTSGGG